MLKTYKGSCHCERVRFEVDADLAKGTGRCNCSYCAKVRNWSTHTKPEAFRLMCDEAGIGEYQFGTLSAHHRFCKTCGVRTHSHGYIKEIGGDYVSVSIACLDDVAPEELASLPVRHMDGRHDNWFNEPAVSSYL